MKLRIALFISMLVLPALLSASLVAAQSKPNVSGTWKMNAEKSKFEKGGPKAITIKFDQKESTLSESLMLTNDRGEQTLNLTYTLDGKESPQQLEGRPIKATAKWEGSFLIIEFKNDDGFNFLRKISVSDDGKTMTIDVKQSSPNGTANDVVLLEKQ
jgi:hypothetical protein